MEIYLIACLPLSFRVHSFRFYELQYKIAFGKWIVSLCDIYSFFNIPKQSNKILQRAVETYDKSKQRNDSSVRVIFNRRETSGTHNHNGTDNSTHIIKVSQTVDWREDEFSRSDLLLKLNSAVERGLRLYYEALTTVITISRKYYAVHFIIFLLDSSL